MKKKGTNQRMLHIDGLKGMMCFMIMFGHFWNIYRACQESTVMKSSLLEIINKSFIGDYFLKATFWLYAFLVISGFLLSFTRIHSAEELIEKSIKRFLRFLIPIFGACVFIFFIQEIVGFHANETRAFFTNNWFQKYYVTKFSLKDVLLDPFNTVLMGKCKFNQPYWVIRDMLLASVVIYICNFMDYKADERKHMGWIALWLAMWLDYPVVVACLAGYLIGYYSEEIEKITEKIYTFLLIGVLVFFLFFMVSDRGTVENVFDPLLYYTLIHSFLLVLINRIDVLRKLFSKKLFVSMGKISFGVYSFHWPVICSFGSIMLIYGFSREWRAEKVLLISLMISIAITVALSVSYYYIVEKMAGKVTSKIEVKKKLNN